MMKQRFSDKFISALSNLSAEEKQSKLLVAVSGGGDSMAMLHALHHSNMNVVVAHVNYKQRGDESNADEQLVRTFCDEHKIDLHICEWPYGRDVSSFQEKARDFRYTFFNELMQSETCSLLLTAHHQNDRIEGFVYNMARGAGLSGMDALVEKNDAVFRPLFRMSKQEIDDYLTEHSVPFRLDKSNLKSTYKRNFIRLEVLPKLKEIHPNALENTVRLLDRNQSVLLELSALYDSVALKYITEAKLSNGKVDEWDVALIRQSIVDVQGFLFHMLKKVEVKCHHKDVELLASHFNQFHTESKVVLLGEFSFEFYREHLYVYSESDLVTEPQVVSQLTDLLKIVPSSKNVEVVEGRVGQFQKGKMYLDEKKMSFPISIRTPQSGDRMKLFGMDGNAKKVSDIQTQEKFPQWRKRTTDLCFDADNELIIFDWSKHAQKIAVSEFTEKAIIIS